MLDFNIIFNVLAAFALLSCCCSLLNLFSDIGLELHGDNRKQ